jgi:hypothetical protein
MAFQLPSFNLLYHVWSGTSPPPALPRLADMLGQLRAPGRDYSAGETPPVTATPIWQLLAAKGTDLRDAVCITGEDIIEVPAGTGRFYVIKRVDDVARGFTNEYRLAYIIKRGPWPTPIP